MLRKYGQFTRKMSKNKRTKGLNLSLWKLLERERGRLEGGKEVLME